MNNKGDIESFVGLDYRQVKLLMKESCAEIDRLSNTLLAMERGNMLFSIEYCKLYELLLLERLDFCRKLNEFYTDDYKKSGWFFRFFISKRIREVATLHRDTLHALMLLRNYMALHEQKGKFID
jgi:hypothetical protein